MDNPPPPPVAACDDPYRRYQASRLHLGSAPADRERVRFLTLKQVTARRAVAYAAHRHADIEVFLPWQCTYRCTVNGEALDVEHGQAVLIQTGDVHADRHPAGACYTILHLEPVRSGGGGVIDAAAPVRARVVDLAGPARLAALAAALRAGGPPDQEALATLEPLALAFFWELVAALPPTALSAAFRDGREAGSFRARALDLLARTPASGFDGDALAVRLGLSRRALEQRFRRHLGRSPEQALLALKADEAARMLASGLPAGEVAEMLGFANPFHFSRVFKRFHGHSPAQHAAAP